MKDMARTKNDSSQSGGRATGISNRETPAEEARERERFPVETEEPTAATGEPRPAASAGKVDGAHGKERGKPTPS